MIYEFNEHDCYPHVVLIALTTKEMNEAKARLYRDLRNFFAQRGTVEISTMVTGHDTLMDYVQGLYRNWFTEAVGLQNRDWHVSVRCVTRRQVAVCFKNKSDALLFKLTHGGK